MTDESKTNDAPLTTETKLSDSVREALGSEDALPEGAGTIETETGVATEAEKQTTEALEQALPDLTPEQIAAFAKDPNVVSAVMEGLDIDAIISELYPVVEEQVTKTHKQKATQEKEVATLSEAIKVAEEDGDFETLGKLLYEKMKAQQNAQEHTEAEQKLIEQGRDSAYNDLDSVVENVYGDVMNAMTPEELSLLDRSRYEDESGYMTAVFTALDVKRQEMVLSHKAQETDAEAEKVAAAAIGARGRVGIGAIPGGSGVESQGETIGDLLRQELRSELGDGESD